MRILLLADMRDPHAINWVSGLLEGGHTPACVSSRRLGEYRDMLPTHVRDTIVHEPRDVLSCARGCLTRVHPALALARRAARGPSSIRDGIGPRSEGTGRLELPLELAISRTLAQVVTRTADRFAPDVVHALRIPYEGVAASMAKFSAPFAVSLWGSDLTRQASSSPRLATAARAVLQRASGVHADCRRDLVLASHWGAAPEAELLLAAGNMGVAEELFEESLSRGGRRLIVFPRGTSPSVNYRGLLRASAALVDRHPDVTFVGVRLKGNAFAESVRRTLPRPEQLLLTGNLTPDELAGLMRQAIAVVSPSIGDGTPNSLLEGMACGALPIAGDIDSLRDLLQGGLEKYLVDARDQAAIERAMNEAISASEALWTKRSEIARSIALEGWSRAVTTERVFSWYEQLVASPQQSPK